MAVGLQAEINVTGAIPAGLSWSFVRSSEIAINENPFAPPEATSNGQIKNSVATTLSRVAHYALCSVCYLWLCVLFLMGQYDTNYLIHPDIGYRVLFATAGLTLTMITLYSLMNFRRGKQRCIVYAGFAIALEILFATMFDNHFATNLPPW